AGRGRSAERPPDDPTALAGLLGPEGPLADLLPGYEHREPQLQMLLAVAQIQARGGMLVVEAGTGTGKSLAYLVPSIARSVKHRELVVVSTNTHTLQEQLMVKDLPSLREWLPWEFKAVLLKGRSNYVSLRRWRRYLAEPCQDADELMFKLKVLLWLHTTESGDRSELRLYGREEVLWNRIASDPLDCVGIHCRKEDCYVHRARAEAEAAPTAMAASTRVADLFAMADAWVSARLGESERREESVRITPALRDEPSWAEIGLAAENTVTALAALDAMLRRSVAGVREWLGGEEPDQGIRELEMIRGRLESSLNLLDEALVHPDANRVYWFTQVSRAENLLLRAAPINVGSLLRERVYAERRSTVFTSATLAVGGTFDYFSSR